MPGREKRLRADQIRTYAFVERGMPLRKGHHIRAWRLSVGVTQRQIAYLLRIRPSTLNDWEKENYQLTRVQNLAFQRLAQIFAEAAAEMLDAP